MDTLQHHTNKSIKGFSWLPFVIIALLTIVIIEVTYFFKDEKGFVVVKFYGNGAAINVSKNYNLTEFYYRNKSKGALLAEEGDVLSINNSFIHFKNIRGDSMHLNDEGDSLIFINGKVNSIIISGKEILLPWFRTMNAATVSDLQSIYFTSKIPSSYIPFLKEIARIKPYTNLQFDDNDSVDILGDYIRQSDFFNPRFISASVTQNGFSLLSHWKNTECLYLNTLDSMVTTPLPAMPTLKQCIIYGDDLKSIIPSFFNGNTQLEKLTLITNLPNYSLLKPLNKLQEISVNNVNDSADMSELKNKFNNLSVLIISGSYSCIDSLASLKKLRWLGLPANTSQQQFNSITTKLQDLQILQINGGDSITNLSALQQMPNLSGLVITDTVTDKQSLYVLKKLHYLSLPQNNITDSTYLLELEKALPGCIIVPNSGACLGSGWLLLLVPFILLLSFFQKRFPLKKANDAS
jgi:hypothetical protein